jgi:O-antigen/teichoic acid export membrane protein
MGMSRISSNMAWLLLDKCLKILLGLTVGIWVARYLGPGAYGELSFVLAYCSLFLVFSDLGFGPIMVRDVVRMPDQLSYYMGTVFLIKLFGSLFALYVMMVFMEIICIENLNKGAVLIVGASYVFKSVNVIDFHYQAIVRSKYVLIARNFALLISSSIKVFLIIAEAELIYFVWIVFVEAMLASIFLIFVYVKQSDADVWRFRLSVASSLVKSGWPVALSGLLIMVHMRVDQIMIGAMLNKEDLGAFSVSVTLSEYWLFIPSILVSSLTPYFVKLRDIDDEMYKMRLRQLFSLMFWMGVIVGLSITFFGEGLVLLLYGEEFKAAYEPLAINIWAGVFVSQALARGIWLINEDLQVYRLYNNLFAVVLNITLNLLLIPNMGITGAAIATLVTQGVATWLISLFWSPLRSSTLDMIRAMNPKYLVISMVR